MHPRRFGRVVCQHVGSTAGDVVNMSAGGMQIRSDVATPLIVDDVINVTLVGLSGSADIRCRVAWVRCVEGRGVTGWLRRVLRLAAGGGQFEAGLQFVELDDRSRAIISEIGAAAGRNETIRPDIARFRDNAA